jgi:hypothetical protein
MPGYATAIREVSAGESAYTGADSMSLASTINHPGGSVVLTCTEVDATIHVFDATFTAIKIASLG